MLAAANWRQAISTFRAFEQNYAWELRETDLGPFLALEGIPQMSPQNGGVQLALLDYHVCYSSSYQVPFLLFRATNTNGEPLSFSSTQELFPQWPSQQTMFSFVTPQEHPLLPGPYWLSLHPCNTSTVLALALGLAADQAQPVTDCILTPSNAPLSETAVALGLYPSDVAAAHCSRSPKPKPANVSQHLASDGGGGDVTATHAAVGEAFGNCQATIDQSGGDKDQVPDLDELLRNAEGQMAEGAGGFVRYGAVGPPGVRWPGGEVPLCPGHPVMLRRYMCAWFSLAGPYVGLVEGRADRALVS